jgi:hypothetical protein
MAQTERGSLLHDRATRGEALSPDEQAELDAWYDAMDREEAAILADSHDDGSLAALRARVRASARQLRAVTQHIEELTVENEHLRREIAASQRQLVQRHAARSA